jgi:hypothetical protein
MSIVHATPKASCAVSCPGYYECITQPERLRSVIRALVLNQSEGRLLAAGVPRAKVRAAAVTDNPAGIGWQIEGPWTEPPFACEVVGYNSVFQLSAREAVRSDGLVITPEPTEIVQLRHRRFRRATVPGGWAISIPSIMAGDRRFSARDVSYQGIACCTDAAFEETIGSGRPSLSLELLVREQDSLGLIGQVCHLTNDPLTGQTFCGLRITAKTRADEAKWKELIDPVLFPTTRDEEGWAEARWGLYEAAGYFQLSGKDPSWFLPLRGASTRTSKLLQSTPMLGYHVVWPIQESRVQATVSILKVYSGSWLGYQMAKIPGDAPGQVSSGRILRAIHVHAYEQAQRDPDLRWLIGYCQDKPIWSRLAHHDFTARHVSGDRACIVRFRALDVSCTRSNGIRPSGLEVGPATAEEQQALLCLLDRTRPRPYCEALDLVPDRIDLASVRSDWRKANLTRERETLVVRRHGEPVAFAVLEDAEEGLHVFRLLDLAHVYRFSEKYEDCLDALFDEARQWYIRRGKQQFVCFLEDELLSLEPPSGTFDMGLADMTIHSADLLPELLEHIQEHTVPREKKSNPRPRATACPSALATIPERP